MVWRVKVTEKGQATIPKRLRDKYEIEEAVVVEDTGSGVLMRPLPKLSEERGSLRHLFDESAEELLESARKEDRERERRLERV